MNILNFPLHTRPIATELSSHLFGEQISDLSQVQRFGVALSAAYATKNTVIINNLVTYAHECVYLSKTVSSSMDAAAEAERNSNCEELNSYVIDLTSAGFEKSSFSDFWQNPAPRTSTNTSPAGVGKGFVELSANENDYAPSQDCSPSLKRTLDTTIFVLAALYVVNRETCMNISAELISVGTVNRNDLMEVIGIVALVVSLSDGIEHVEEPTYKVLLIDDDARITRRLKLSLERMTNFVVSVENNSSKALQVAHEFSPDIIVLDLYMPGMSGGEVLASLKADPKLSATKVVILSSLLTQEEAGKNGTIIGDNLYLPKTYEDKMIVASLRGQLNILERAAV
jgi:CheY-like chemotaxis protein